MNNSIKTKLEELQGSLHTLKLESIPLAEHTDTPAYWELWGEVLESVEHLVNCSTENDQQPNQESKKIDK